MGFSPNDCFRKKIWCGEPIIPCHYVNNRINILWDKTVFAKTDNAVYAVKSLVTTPFPSSEVCLSFFNIMVVLHKFLVFFH